MEKKNVLPLRRVVLFGSSTLLMVLCACKKFITIPPPPGILTSAEIFEQAPTATGAIVGLYSEMMDKESLFSNSGTTIYTGMYADELLYTFPGPRDEFEQNQLSEANHSTISNLFWNPAYRFIYVTNACLKGLQQSQTLQQEIKSQLMGEAYFARAFCFFELVNIFGDVPLVLTTNYEISSRQGRTPSAEVYRQIISDLQKAIINLPFTYDTSYGGLGRIRPNKSAAMALLARAYLYNRQFSEAEQAATTLIASPMFTLQNDLDSVFLLESTEAIWQLYPVRYGMNTWEGNLLLPTDGNVIPDYTLRQQLYNEFDHADKRKHQWIGQHTVNSNTFQYPSKYKIRAGNVIAEPYMVLRLAEQYLIRAEARAQLNNVSGGIADINIIRHRAGLGDTPANTRDQLLAAVEQERRFELFCEWGHRWFDLKRTNRAASVLSPIKPRWQATDTLWPVPADQIRVNIALHQNAGY